MRTKLTKHQMLKKMQEMAISTEAFIKTVAAKYVTANGAFIRAKEMLRKVDDERGWDAPCIYCCEPGDSDWYTKPAREGYLGFHRADTQCDLVDLFELEIINEPTIADPAGNGLETSESE